MELLEKLATGGIEDDKTAGISRPVRAVLVHVGRAGKEWRRRSWWLGRETRPLVVDVLVIGGEYSRIS